MSIPEIQAVILAAGTGSRLGGLAKGRPKCLLEIGGRTLLQHHLGALQDIGVERILVVAGHGAHHVLAETGRHGAVHINEIYAETNSLYSLWLIRKWITGSVMIINGDVLAAPQIYRHVVETEGSALAFDSNSGMDEEEMKVRFESRRLTAINKEMKPEHSHGENLGILKFDAAGAKALFEAADGIVAEGRLNEWAPAAVERAAKEIAIKGVDVGGIPWTEIDFPEDLDRARQEVWPAIERRHVAKCAPRPSGHPTCSPSLIPKLAS